MCKTLVEEAAQNFILKSNPMNLGYVHILLFKKLTDRMLSMAMGT